MCIRDSPVAVEPPFSAAELLRREVEPAAVMLEKRPPSDHADPPADNRADEVPQRASKGDGDERPEALRDLGAEERHRRTEGSSCERAADDHDELARRGEHGVDE